VARQDLPIPAWLFAWAASLVLIVFFFVLSAAWRKPRFEEEDWRSLRSGLSRTLVSRPTQIVCGLLGILLLGVAIYAGLRGTEAPDRSFVLTFLFVTTWLGFPFFSALLGDIFRPVNPWRAVGRAAGTGFKVIAGQGLPVSATRPTTPTPGRRVLARRTRRRRVARGRARERTNLPARRALPRDRPRRRAPPSLENLCQPLLESRRDLVSDRPLGQPFHQ
jgi:hypothetical protein